MPHPTRFVEMNGYERGVGKKVTTEWQRPQQGVACQTPIHLPTKVVIFGSDRPDPHEDDARRRRSGHGGYSVSDRI
jgi:hypothetical protein